MAPRRGLKNIGWNSYANCIIQCLLNLPSCVEAIDKIGNSDKKFESTLAALFREMQQTDSTPIYPEAFLNFVHEQFAAGTQHDASEFASWLIKKVPGLSALFEGDYGSGKTTKPLFLSELKTVHESHVEDLAASQKVEMFPDLLMVHLLRFNNDMTKSKMVYRLQETFELENSEGVKEKYHMRAVVSHIGPSIRRGHFVAYVQDGEMWLEMNDDHDMAPIEWQEMEGVFTYLLFLERSKASSVPHAGLVETWMATQKSWERICAEWESDEETEDHVGSGDVPEANADGKPTDNPDPVTIEDHSDEATKDSKDEASPPEPRAGVPLDEEKPLEKDEVIPPASDGILDQMKGCKSEEKEWDLVVRIVNGHNAKFEAVMSRLLALETETKRHFQALEERLLDWDRLLEGVRNVTALEYLRLQKIEIEHKGGEKTSLQ